MSTFQDGSASEHPANLGNSINSDNLPIERSENASSTEPPSNSPQFKIAGEKVTRIDRFFDSASDWFSSILVKETRQALASRQFIVTFFLLLGISAFWSFVALSFRQGSSNNLPDDIGPIMLTGFMYILGFPLCIIIPFSTFRSLAQEYEDGTIQMILITTMKPFQIVAGKLGSALLQMLVYLSVLAPCIAFCYLLRGIDIQQIWFSLLITVIVSVGLCCLALALGSLSMSRIFGQILAGIFLITSLIAYWLWCAFTYGYIFNMTGVNEATLNVMTFGFVAAFGSTAMLLFACASAQISFPSSNRTTLLRAIMFIQQTLFLGWILGMMCTFGGNEEMIFSTLYVALFYWLLMGSMMMACDSTLSGRQKRSLPKTRLTRSLFSLFMPGPGRAYLFAICNAVFVFFWSLIVFVLSDFLIRDFGTSRNFGGTVSSVGFPLAIGAGMICLLYFLFFLSIVFLLSRRIARKTKQPFVIGNLLLTVVIFTGFTMIGFLFSSPFGNSNSYNLAHTFNWIWTVAEIAQGPNPWTILAVLIVTMITVPLTAWSVFIASRELQETPDEIPERVQQEIEAERLAKETPPDDETIDEIFADVPKRQVE